MRSRRIVIFGGIAAAALGVPAIGYLGERFGPLPDFEPIAGLPGFRRIAAGSSSAGASPWIGLGERRARPAPATIARVRGDICTALHGGAAARGDTVPIASFSDYYCPYCRVQTARLAERADDRDVAVTWHELPILGDASEAAARAALAAGRQGAYAESHERLLRTPFQATPDYLAALSEDLDLDHARLVADMESPAIDDALETSAALSETFAFVGTPAMVVGRTVIQGRISDRTLDRIIALEREEGWSASC